jgi:transcriptional regulator with XRE-family HTH domain
LPVLPIPLAEGRLEHPLFAVMQPDVQALKAKIGLRLREAREAQSLSLSQLCTRAGSLLSKSPISNYEQGIRRLAIEEARLLAKTLGTVSATYLLCLDDEGVLTYEEEELVLCYRRTDDRGRATVLAFARSRRESKGSRLPIPCADGAAEFSPVSG